MINIDFVDEKPFIYTSGGEYQDPDFTFSEYSIHIGDLTITLTPEQITTLFRRIEEHLKNNGRI